MSVQYLSELNMPLDRGAYLDCGIFFPFFLKQFDINIIRWSSDICAWLNKYNIYTTPHILRELDKAYNAVPMNKRIRKQIIPLYHKIIKNTIKDNIIVCDDDPILSIADLSLLHRKRVDIPLITSDKALYTRDKNSILVQWSVQNNELSFRTESVI